MRVLEFKKGQPRYPALNNIKEGSIAAAAMAPLIKQVAREKGKTAINLWCRGTSGMFYASFVAKDIIGMPTRVCYLRKEGEKSHGCDFPEPIFDHSLDVFVDDFIESGETIDLVYQSLCKNKGQGKIFDLVALAHRLFDSDFDKLERYTKTMICNEDIR